MLLFDLVPPADSTPVPMHLFTCIVSYHNLWSPGIVDKFHETLVSITFPPQVVGSIIASPVSENLGHSETLH